MASTRSDADGLEPGAAASEVTDTDSGRAADLESMPVQLGRMVGAFTPARTRIGTLAHRSLLFSGVLGLSAAQRSMVHPDHDESLANVKLPDGVLPGQGDDEAEMHPALRDPGMAAIARMYLRKTAPKRTREARHGLPAVMRRAARTAMGVLTGPGSVAMRLMPASMQVRKNESHGALTDAAPASTVGTTRTTTRSAVRTVQRGEAPRADGKSTAAGVAGAASAPSRSTAQRTPAARAATPPRSFAAGPDSQPTYSKEVVQAAQVYARADTPDARAAAFAAAMGAVQRAEPEPTFQPPTARVSRRTANATPRSALWSAAAGRAGGFSDAAPDGAGSTGPSGAPGSGTSNDGAADGASSGNSTGGEASAPPGAPHEASIQRTIEWNDIRVAPSAALGVDESDGQRAGVGRGAVRTVDRASDGGRVADGGRSSDGEPTVGQLRRAGQLDPSVTPLRAHRGGLPALRSVGLSSGVFGGAAFTSTVTTTGTSTGISIGTSTGTAPTADVGVAGVATAPVATPNVVLPTAANSDESMEVAERVQRVPVARPGKVRRAPQRTDAAAATAPGARASVSNDRRSEVVSAAAQVVAPAETPLDELTVRWSPVTPTVSPAPTAARTASADVATADATGTASDAAIDDGRPWATWDDTAPLQRASSAEAGTEAPVLRDALPSALHESLPSGTSRTDGTSSTPSTSSTSSATDSTRPGAVAAGAVPTTVQGPSVGTDGLPVQGVVQRSTDAEPEAGDVSTESVARPSSNTASSNTASSNTASSNTARSNTASSGASDAARDVVARRDALPSAVQQSLSTSGLADSATSAGDTAAASTRPGAAAAAAVPADVVPAARVDELPVQPVAQVQRSTTDDVTSDAPSTNTVPAAPGASVPSAAAPVASNAPASAPASERETSTPTSSSSVASPASDASVTATPSGGEAVTPALRDALPSAVQRPLTSAVSPSTNEAGRDAGAAPIDRSTRPGAVAAGAVPTEVDVPGIASTPVAVPGDTVPQPPDAPVQRSTADVVQPGAVAPAAPASNAPASNVSASSPSATTAGPSLREPLPSAASQPLTNARGSTPGFVDAAGASTDTPGSSSPATAPRPGEVAARAVPTDVTTSAIGTDGASVQTPAGVQRTASTEQSDAGAESATGVSPTSTPSRSSVSPSNTANTPAAASTSASPVTSTSTAATPTSSSVGRTSTPSTSSTASTAPSTSGVAASAAPAARTEVRRTRTTVRRSRELPRATRVVWRSSVGAIVAAPSGASATALSESTAGSTAGSSPVASSAASAIDATAVQPGALARATAAASERVFTVGDAPVSTTLDAVRANAASAATAAATPAAGVPDQDAAAGRPTDAASRAAARRASAAAVIAAQSATGPTLDTATDAPGSSGPTVQRSTKTPGAATNAGSTSSDGAAPSTRSADEFVAALSRQSAANTSTAQVAASSATTASGTNNQSTSSATSNTTSNTTSSASTTSPVGSRPSARLRRGPELASVGLRHGVMVVRRRGVDRAAADALPISLGLVDIARPLSGEAASSAAVITPAGAATAAGELPTTSTGATAASTATVRPAASAGPANVSRSTAAQTPGSPTTATPPSAPLTSVAASGVLPGATARSVVPTAAASGVQRAIDGTSLVDASDVISQVATVGATEPVTTAAAGPAVQRTASTPNIASTASPADTAAATSGRASVAVLQRRFLDTLAEQGGASAVPLPDRFRPLARSLAGRPILVSHGASSQAALRAVDRPAATLGNVVHLQRSPDESPETIELLAHELVHAASAPVAPRFFAEPDRDHEEHRAHQIGRIARQAAVERIDPATLPLANETVVLPRVIQRSASSAAPSGAGLAAALGSAPNAVQRSATPPPPPGSTPSGGIDHTAGGYAAEVFGGSGGVAGLVQRTPNGSTIRRDPSGATDLPSGLAADADIATSIRLNQLDELIELIERRVINELERRGGRVRGLW